MAVSALELRPRTSLALLDATIRFVTRQSGPWALTLPTAGLVVVAALQLQQAVRRGDPLAFPSLLLALAWVLRCAAQGAACHHVEQLLLAPTAPPLRASVAAALSRLPRLVFAAGYWAWFHALFASFTGGLYIFFFSAPMAGYAAAMAGQGRLWSLYRTTSGLLGAARRHHLGMRGLVVAQAVVFLNLHAATLVLLWLGENALGLDLAMARRFAGLTNGTYLFALLLLTWALFEPLRAVEATLLIVDGRVRQEGLDLLAQVAQLPTRRRAIVNVGAWALFAALAGLTLPARAIAAPEQVEVSQAPPASDLSDRFADLCRACGISEDATDRFNAAALALAEPERVHLSGLLQDLEAYVYDDRDCSPVDRWIAQGLPLLDETAVQAGARALTDPKARAEQILQRLEFQEPQRAEKEKTELESPEWWRRFLEAINKAIEAIFDWLRERLSGNDAPTRVERPTGGGTAVAYGIAVLLAAAVLVVLIALVWGALEKRRARRPADVHANAALPLEPGGETALSRPPESWAELADALAAQGRYREAMRSLYLALLARLHQQGAIDYDPAKSNWDYLYGFRGTSTLLPPFRELTTRFDFAYYGALGADGAGYQAFRALSQPLLAPSAPEAAGA